jgi:hypothetical protein
MALDFAVLGESGAPERFVSLSVDLHHELLTTAADLGMDQFQCFADYYQDAEVVVDALPRLVEQIRALRTRTSSEDLQHFLDDLGDLMSYAVATGRSLHAIAD